MTNDLRYLSNHWFLVLLFCLACFAVAGGIAPGYGIPHLFRDAPQLGEYEWTAYRNSPAMLSQVCLVVLAGVFWSFVHHLEVQRGRACSLGKLLGFVLPRTLLFAGLGLVAASFPLTPQVARPTSGELFRSLVGTAVGFVVVVLLLALGHGLSVLLRRSGVSTPVVWEEGARTGILHLVPFLLLLGAVTVHPKLVPAVAIFLVLCWLAVFYLLFCMLREPWRLPAFALLAVSIILGSGRSYKLTFPGFEKASGRSYYDSDERVPLDEEPESSASAFLLDPVELLDRWRSRFDRPPKLVVVCTSGGAYRASFWTAVVLDQLSKGSEGALPGFGESIRLITGASGGMVGAAYYVVSRPARDRQTLVDRMLQETESSQRTGALTTRFPIRGDSLSPVAQQLAQRDLLRVFWPRRGGLDRGRVLEAQWSSLDLSFKELLAEEAAGRRPSILLSPMLVETGQPLLISNLDLTGVRDSARAEAIEFFRFFPEAHASFTLATAVRMNATFPYVSPAVSLPTEPAARVVDAGYYDNFGVNLAVAFLAQERVLDWIRDETSGVLMVQIRAYGREATAAGPGEDDDSSGDSAGRLGTAFQWLTSPLEGIGSARNASMMFRNQQELRNLERILEWQGTPFEAVAFENTRPVSMSWYLPETELEAMQEEWHSAYNQEQLCRLEHFWRAGATCAPAPPRS